MFRRFGFTAIMTANPVIQFLARANVLSAGLLAVKNITVKHGGNAGRGERI